uniref:DUF4283 domain-containing protein n=1 Tax=Brassica oleracea TaxID=3712 RepID=A0A3P6FTK8_BRAOL|nr:unnamed protein product [Brassica oleracea]
MWGKEKRLEIHNNPLNRSTLVRIQSEYLGQKIFEKNIWYVGDSMFHTAQWSSAHSKSTPPLKAIKIGAHLTGVPLDMRHSEGSSLVAGLVGDPKETDEFTKNLVSLTLSHVKVEVDLTKLLPPVVEFERQSSELVEVLVHYPWVPPTCSHCHEMGHIVRNCLSYMLPEHVKEMVKDPERGKQSVKDPERGKQSVKKQKRYQPVDRSKLVATPQKDSQASPSVATVSSSNMSGSSAVDPSVVVPVDLVSNAMEGIIRSSVDVHAVKTNQLKTIVALPFPPPEASINPFVTPQSSRRPPLKRSRSSPTLSPPSASNTNPFSLVLSLPLSNSFMFLDPILSFNPTISFDTRDGRIILIWRDSIKVQVLNQSRQCITCKLDFPHQPPVIYSTIYASNLSAERVDLWAELIQLHSDLDLDNHNWIIGGDLNQIIHPCEHSRPHVVVPDGLMYQLQDCFLQMGVFDLRYNGPCHTWTNNQPDTTIAKKLDRLLVNTKTIISFPLTLASFLPPIFFDHSPCIIDLAFSLPKTAGNKCQTLAQLCWKLKFRLFKIPLQSPFKRRKTYIRNGFFYEK